MPETRLELTVDSLDELVDSTDEILKQAEHAYYSKCHSGRWFTAPEESLSLSIRGMQGRYSPESALESFRTAYSERFQRQHVLAQEKKEKAWTQAVADLFGKAAGSSSGETAAAIFSQFSMGVISAIVAFAAGPIAGIGTLGAVETYAYAVRVNIFKQMPRFYANLAEAGLSLDAVEVRKVE